MDLNTRTNKFNIFAQNNLGENECAKSSMKIRQTEQQRGRDFDLHTFDLHTFDLHTFDSV